MDATAETTSLERTISIAAPPETVWEFFVDPEKATRWMGTSATLEARPGGEYRCDVLPGHIARGRRKRPRTGPRRTGRRGTGERACTGRTPGRGRS